MSIRWEYVSGGNDMFRTVQAAAFGGQSAALVPVEVELDRRGRLADDESVAGHGDIILEGLPEGPELFAVAVSINGDLLNQVVQSIQPAVSTSSSL